MIELADIHKSFGAKQVLRGLNLTVEHRRKHGHHRRVGDRKIGHDQMHPRPCSTRSRGHLAGWRGCDPVGDRDAFLARFGMLFQGGALFDSMPSGRTSPSGCCAAASSARRPRPAPSRWKSWPASALAPRPPICIPAELSGGMQKRAGLARAIAAEPEIIFFDEPTAGLDPIMAGVINRLIREHRRRDGGDRGDHHPRHDHGARRRPPGGDAA